MVCHYLTSASLEQAAANQHQVEDIHAPIASDVGRIAGCRAAKVKRDSYQVQQAETAVAVRVSDGGGRSSVGGRPSPISD